MNCQHCADANGIATNRCHCMFCGLDGSTVQDRRPGPCLFCKSRKFNEQYAHIIAANDPSLPENWERHPAADGNRGYKVYKPLKGLR